jgi:hypothetical protein
MGSPIPAHDRRGSHHHDSDARRREGSGARVVKQQRIGWTHKLEERFRKARVRSHARLAATWLYACERSGSKNQ